MGWLLGFGIPFAYFLGVGVSYRVLYVRTMTEYLRWKNARPKTRPSMSRYPYDYRIYDTPQYGTYKWFLKSRYNEVYPPCMSWYWPGLITVVPAARGVNRLLKPEIKIPDAYKIEKLELEDL